MKSNYEIKLYDNKNSNQSHKIINKTKKRVSHKFKYKTDFIINIFSEYFVKRNKNKCHLIVNNKYSKLFSYIIYNNAIKHIKLKIISNLIYLNRMFYNCDSLISMPEIYNFDTKRVVDMQYMFYNCTSLISLPDISKWNTNNVRNMKNMFYNCNSLENLDIYNWKTNKVTNISGMFSKCSSLIMFYDILDWDVSNVTHMNELFSECKSL